MKDDEERAWIRFWQSIRDREMISLVKGTIKEAFLEGYRAGAATADRCAGGETH